MPSGFVKGHFIKVVVDKISGRVVGTYLGCKFSLNGSIPGRSVMVETAVVGIRTVTMHLEKEAVLFCTNVATYVAAM